VKKTVEQSGNVKLHRLEFRGMMDTYIYIYTPGVSNHDPLLL